MKPIYAFVLLFTALAMIVFFVDAKAIKRDLNSKVKAKALRKRYWNDYDFDGRGRGRYPGGWRRPYHGGWWRGPHIHDENYSHDNEYLKYKDSDRYNEFSYDG
ncbi:25062_t:CDS:2 [Gigaspora margarita]|uniref:25062_t:CDS:1 n=1 Tax=Gigaspora margarita TaxID=4874 RepID=A0ABM8W3U7_GIGMA|nr:25062_t:CDS:2 [Gigaspora margarita]